MEHGFLLSPTVYPTPGFDPTRDCETINNAFKHWGADTKSIIKVIANRTYAERQQILVTYRNMYDKDLMRDFKYELRGDFLNLVRYMFMDYIDYLAKELHLAVNVVGTDETCLIDILCTMSNNDIKAIKEAYFRFYGKTLESDLASDLSGHFRNLMVSLCRVHRDETCIVDPDAAIRDARELLKAGELRFGTDDAVFDSILISRNICQLKRIFEEYEKLTGHGLEIAIEREFSGDVREGLLAIAKFITQRSSYFAESLYKALKKGSVDDRRLMRLILMRVEVDMGEIKEQFKIELREPLESMLASDTCGDFKKCLIELVTPN